MPRETITAATCRSCGACCVSLHDEPAFCDVTKADEERLGRRFVRLHVLHPRPFDRLVAALDGSTLPHRAIKTAWKEQKRGPLAGAEVCACVALRGSLMDRVRCTVYEKRPTACRTAVPTLSLRGKLPRRRKPPR